MRHLTSIIFLLISFFASAQNTDCFPEKPSREQLVNNLSVQFPQFLSAGEVRKLESKLQEFDRQTYIQVAVVIVDDLCGMTANEFATEIGEKWSVGGIKSDKDKKNLGIVILIKPTETDGGRDVYIATGYGMEEYVSAISASRIVNDIMIPNFKAAKYFEAINLAADKIIELTNNPEIRVQEEQRNGNQEQGNNNEKEIKWWHILIAIIIVILYFSFGGRGGGGFTMTRYGGTSWGGNFGGGGSSFRGFGGGSFGGGGAGGKW
jgi:uncharacterized protein